MQETSYNLSISTTVSNTTGFDREKCVTNTTDLLTVNEEEDDITFLHVFKSIVFILIILVAVFGNSLVIASFYLYRRLRGINNYFLVSLAFADLFVALFAMTFNATQQIFGRSVVTRGEQSLQTYTLIGQEVQLTSTSD